MRCVVIIGGGAAGIRVAQDFAKNLTEANNTEVIVIEKSSYFYHVVGAPRAYVEADYTDKMFIPYDNAIPKHAAKFVRIVRGVAMHISADTNEVSYHAIGSDDKESQVTEKLQFDYLVLATGSTYSVPIKPDSNDYSRSATEAKLQEVRGHIEKAEKVVVIGGGAVGCEVAAEIKAKYPNKSVTIVEANQRLLSGNNVRDEFYVKLNESLEKLGVKVVLATLEQQMDASLVTDRGAVKVNDKLQLEGAKYTHMFALGDMSNHPTPKMAEGYPHHLSFSSKIAMDPSAIQSLLPTLHQQRTFETQQELLQLNLLLLEFQAKTKLPDSFMDHPSTIRLFRFLNPALPAALVKIRQLRAQSKVYRQLPHTRATTH